MTSRNETAMSYDLSEPFGFDALDAVRPGSNILVSGPAMTGKSDLAFSILAEGSRRGEGAIVVTTSDPAEVVIDELADRVDGLEESRVAVVDCRGEGGRSSERTADGGFVYRVSSPGDMTGIGIGITKGIETLANNGVQEGRFVLDSLSTMLTYTDRKTVFKFCHVLSSRFDSTGYVGLFTIDTGAHDDQTIQVLKQAFDGMVEIRNEDGSRQARVLGLAGAPSDWHEF
ncbi:MAG: ATPase domain-containing protein [Haloarculaceae archaeon]